MCMRARHRSFLEADLSTSGGAATLAAATERVLQDAPLHVLVNNAGAGTGGQSLGEPTFSATAFDDVFTLNVRAPTLLLHHLVAVLARAGGASVINISSIVASRPSGGGFLPYR
jgi:NAD(P)-dependent dehydrogenase (short-subunit alcohol dehydrogenase family)